MINIIHWFLTRRCNLNCSYCTISKNYDNLPKEYPNINYYIKNEMSKKFLFESLLWFKKYNPDIFHIFLGGEPFLRKDIFDIINFSQKNNILYTFISNFSTSNINDIKKNNIILDGITASIDPNFIFSNKNDRDKKSLNGLKKLIELKNNVKDRVAEIVIDNENKDYVISLLKLLTENNITCIPSFIDIKKNKYYDFSNITDKNVLVQPTEEIKELLSNIINSNFKLHMPEILFDIFSILPSNLNCKVDKNINILTIDSDGTPRLCLRIKGIETPKKNILEYIYNDSLKDELFENLIKDKNNLCEGCNWITPLYSNCVDENKNLNFTKLLHLSERNH